MKRKILFAVVGGILLTACTDRQDFSSKVEQHRLRNSRASALETNYEGLYETFYTITAQELEERGVANIFSDIYRGVISKEELSYENISDILENNQQYVLDWFNEAIEENGLSVDFERTEIAVNSYIMDSILLDIQDSLYITPNYRHRIFENDSIGDYEKVSLSVIFALNNRIYEHNTNYNTVIIKDSRNRYFKIQLFDNDLWLSPWDIYEITIDDFSLIDTTEIRSAIEQRGVYHEFCSINDRNDYLSLLESGGTEYYVTRRECDIQYDDDIDRLNNEAAMHVAVSLIFIPNPTHFFLHNAVTCVWYLARQIEITKERDDCYDSAEDN